MNAVEIVEGDVFDLDSIYKAMKDVPVAFYLVHSMTASGDFESNDRTAANNFAVAAKHSGVQRIVYLGGLGDSSNVLYPVHYSVFNGMLRHIANEAELTKPSQRSRCRKIPLTFNNILV